MSSQPSGMSAGMVETSLVVDEEEVTVGDPFQDPQPSTSFSPEPEKPSRRKKKEKVYPEEPVIISPEDACCESQIKTGEVYTHLPHAETIKKLLDDVRKSFKVDDHEIDYELGMYVYFYF